MIVNHVNPVKGLKNVKKIVFELITKFEKRGNWWHN